MLTNDQKRIRIAVACGWTYESGVAKYDGKDIPWTVWHKDGKKYNNCPDYFGSLDAMHEAEKAMTKSQGSFYYEELEDFCKAQGTHPCSATAAQRAEAFGRTLNLW